MRRIPFLRIAVLALTACALMGSLSAAEPAQGATTWDTLPGFNHVKSVFSENGFPNYKATYVRCYSNAEWRKVRRGHVGLMGWYDGGVWIHVRAPTCDNSAKALNQGQMTYTNIVALSTVIHEAIHRQGIRSESLTACLSTWLAAHAVLAWTGSEEKALKTLGLARRFNRERLLPRYQSSDAQCVQMAVVFGVQPITVEDDPVDPVPPSPPPPPPPPPPPAEHLVGTTVGDYVSVSDLSRVPVSHTRVVIWYSTVGPYDLDVRLNGSTGTYGGRYRVNGPGELNFMLPVGWPTINSGPMVSVSASPDFTWAISNPDQSKIELRVVTRP